MATGLAILLVLVVPVAAKAGEIYREDFEAVTPPILPSGWNVFDNPAAGSWTNSGASPVAGLHSASVEDQATTSFHALTGPAIAIPARPTTLQFRHSYAFEACDGGVLTMGIDRGPHADILTAGGTFLSGGYTDTLGCAPTTPPNPIQGAAAWANGSAASVLTVVQLPAAVLGHELQLGFGIGTDNSVEVPGGGWRIDDISIISEDPPAATGHPPTWVTGGKKCKRKKKRSHRAATSRKKRCRKRKKG
jgi:hypothetical protein